MSVYDLQKSLFLGVDPAIQVTVAGNLMTLQNVSEVAASRLRALSSSTNFNNPIRRLQACFVSLQNNPSISYDVSGLVDILNHYLHNEHVNAVFNGAYSYPAFGDANISDLVDNYTSTHPGLPKTQRQVKIYTFKFLFGYGFGSANVDGDEDVDGDKQRLIDQLIDKDMHKNKQWLIDQLTDKDMWSKDKPVHLRNRADDTEM